MTTLINRQKSCHWYSKDATSQYEIMGKNGKIRPTNVKDAREHGFIPSVTTVLSLLEKGGLTAWKQEQCVLAALTLPRLTSQVIDNNGNMQTVEESTDDFAKRVVEDAFKQSEDAMSLGSFVHDAIEKTIKCEGIAYPKDFMHKDLVENAIKWVKENIASGICEKICVGKIAGLWYAGKIDCLAVMKDGSYALVDFKTQNTKKDKKINAYEDWIYQLSAYLNLIKGTIEYGKLYLEINKPCRVINVVISTSEKDRPVEVHEWTEQDIREGFRIFHNTLDTFYVKNSLPIQEIPVTIDESTFN